MAADFQANRGPARMYVTTVLRALADTNKIHKHGYYHDGRFGTLQDVVDHYDAFWKLQLSDKAKADLIEYLRSV
jgi:cytochrome c peroxidase